MCVRGLKVRKEKWRREAEAASSARSKARGDGAFADST